MSVPLERCELGFVDFFGNELILHRGPVRLLIVSSTINLREYLGHLVNACGYVTYSPYMTPVMRVTRIQRFLPPVL
ncbi:MAG: hypothetical protein HPY55_05170 [Firmicutes bacterium]|nr:hypothetical protein [Bacillota bacterium]